MFTLLSVLFQPVPGSWGAARLGVGYPALGNASVALYALHPLEIEAGIEGSLGYNGYTLRAGPALALAEHRNDSGRGVTVHTPMLVGYRFMNFGREFNGHALTVNPTLTVDFWLAQHFAVELQLTVGASFTLSDRSSGIGAPVIPDGQLRLGFAL